MAKKNSSAGSRPGSPVVRNKKARFNYHVEDTIEAGMTLVGSEVKSLRQGKANIEEAYARIRNGEVWLENMHIGPYSQATIEQHEPRRPRKLLLHRREIDRFLGRAAEQGYTIIPLRIYWKRGRAKVELGIARGKKQYDKREDIKRRDAMREAEREVARHDRTR